MESENAASGNADRITSSEAIKQLLKSNLKTGNFHCNFESCNRYFQSNNAFKKHLRKKHAALLSFNYNNNIEPVNANLRADNVEPAITATLSSNLIDQNEMLIDNSNIELEPSMLTTDEGSLNDLKSTALILVSDLHSNTSTNRSIATEIFKNVKNTILAKVCTAIKSKIERTKLRFAQKSELLNFVEDCSNICNFVDTEHKFLKELTEKNVYVAPQKLVVDCEVREIRNTGFPIPALKEVEIITVPLRISFKQLFELPGVLEATLIYQNALMATSLNEEDMENDEPLVLVNFVQGSLWRKYILEYENKVVIPFFLYQDDFGVNNQLGTHAKAQSLSGFYIIFPSLPPEFKSKLENILLASLFHSSILKTKGNQKTLQFLVDEINFLQKDGIDICVDGKVTKVFFKMALIIGDNVSLNAILDFVKSFSAFYTCRFCRVFKDDMHFMIELDYSLLRNRSNYLEDVENSVSDGGIHNDSIFNLIDDFHIMDNASVDIIHDFYETVAHSGVCKSLKYFIYEAQYFSLKTLNSRKAKFNYGINDSANLAPPITKEQLDKNKLKASASEMIIIIQHLLIMIGDLVARDDEVWLYLVNLVEIHDILIYKEITKADLKELKSIIQKHHKSYIDIFGDHLRPTFHNMLHYYDIILKVGPLSGIWSIRGEARHRNFKVTAASTCSRRNLPLTLAIKNQLVYANRLLNQKGFEDGSGKSKKSKAVDIEELKEFAFIRDQIDLTKSYSSQNQAVSGSRTVVRGMFIMCFDLTLQFYKIRHILRQSETEDIMFVGEEYFNTNFDTHFLAYGLKIKPDSYKVLTGEDFARFPNESHFLPNGDQLIRATHY